MERRREHGGTAKRIALAACAMAVLAAAGFGIFEFVSG